MDVATSHQPKMSTARDQKRRPITYGKAGRAKTSSSASWEATLPEPRPVIAESSAKVTPSVEPPERRKATGKLVRPSATLSNGPPKDLFDVPSSDDEFATSHKLKRPVKSVSPLPKRPLAPNSPFRSATHDSDYDSGTSDAKRRKAEAILIETQLFSEMATAAERAGLPVAQQKLKSSVGAAKQALSNHARVQRAKIPVKARPPKEPQGPKTAVRKSRTGSALHAPRKMTAPKAIASNSAPAQLEVMISKSPPAPSCLHTPNKMRDGAGLSRRANFDGSSIPQTPPSRGTASPVPRSGAITPRQAEQLSKLLGGSSVIESPSSLSIHSLQISASAKKPSITELLRLSSEIPRVTATKRTRLIDALGRPSRVTHGDDDDEDEDMEGEDSSEDEDMEDVQSGEDEAMSHSSDPGKHNIQPAEIDLPAASLSQGSVKITYGSRRTYVEDSNLENDLMLGASLGDLQVPVIPGLLRSKSAPQRQLDSSQDEDDLEGSQIKGVHELRASGGNARFADDFENLVQDIEYRGGSSMSRPRAGMMEMCEKLSDKRFVRRMVDQGLDQRLLGACAGVNDLIFRFSLAAAVALIVEGNAPVAVLTHVQKSECFQSLFDTLVDERNVSAIAKDRRSNMSKVAQSSLADAVKGLSELALWGDVKPAQLSPHLLALKAIEMLVRKLRELGRTDELLNEHMTSQLLDVAERSLENLPSASTSLKLAVSTLESGSVIPGRTQSVWTAKRRTRLAAMLPCVFKLSTPESDELSMLSLRLMLNLTNNNAKCCEQFAQTELIQLLVTSVNASFDDLKRADHASNKDDEDGEDEEPRPQLDRLILALGAVINLAEHCDSARKAVLGDDGTQLSKLVATFIAARAQSADADSSTATTMVAFGWLAVALGNLCLNGEVRRNVARQMDGGRITAVIGTIREFIVYHQKVDRALYEGSEGEEVLEGYTERLKALVARLGDGH